MIPEGSFICLQLSISRNPHWISRRTEVIFLLLCLTRRWPESTSNRSKSKCPCCMSVYRSEITEGGVCCKINFNTCHTIFCHFEFNTLQNIIDYSVVKKCLLAFIFSISWNLSPAPNQLYPAFSSPLLLLSPIPPCPVSEFYNSYFKPHFQLFIHFKEARCKKPKKLWKRESYEKQVIHNLTS